MLNSAMLCAVTVLQIASDFLCEVHSIRRVAVAREHTCRVVGSQEPRGLSGSVVLLHSAALAPPGSCKNGNS